MKKSYQIIEEIKKKLDEKKASALTEGLNFHWETPNQKKAYLDAFSSVEVKDYPIMNYVQSYADFLRSKLPAEPVSEEISEQEIEEAVEDESKKKVIEIDESYSFDENKGLLTFVYEPYFVTALYSPSYINTFYKVWIEDPAQNKIVYKFDYGISIKDSSLDGDDLEDILDLLFIYIENVKDDAALEAQFAAPKVSSFDRQKKVDGDSDVA